ncbi:MAG TPA: glucose-6-phosphate isomerase family protein [Candidatus Norongarragalinales archaeon]|jgi:glucose-6-phosphate isomerase|nr:glucose-6-phosphate isomerase family protein [Candidatus Norongarragalinales archaeon]
MSIVRAVSGALRLEWDTRSNELRANGKIAKPSIVRTVKELYPVIQDREWKNHQDNKKVAYWVFGNIAASESDAKALKKNGVSVAVTIFPDGTFGKELAKTFGHYHKKLGATWLEVLSGQATFVLQHENPATKKVDDVILADATPGKGVMIRPGYGHVSVNASTKKILILLSASKKLGADHDVYKKKGGAAVQLFLGGFVSKNRFYDDLPEPRRTRAAKAEKPLYDKALREPKSLGF